MFKEAESLEQEDPQEAIAKYQELLQFMKDPVQRVFILNKIGGIYKSYSTAPEMAIEFYEQSLSILQSLNEPALKVLTLNKLGDVYEALAKYEQSFEFYNQALPLLDNLDKPSLKALALTNLGQTYRLLGDYQQALDSLNEALQRWQAFKGNSNDQEPRTIVLGLFDAAILHAIRAVYNAAIFSRLRLQLRRHSTVSNLH